MSNEVKQTFERRINSLIGQINFLNKQDDYDEIISNLSKYLCILIAGYTEKMFVYYLNKYFENKAHPKLKKYLSNSIKHTTNLQMLKIEEMLCKFDDGWVETLKKDADYQEYKDSLQSIYDNRNKIAHGEISNIGFKSLEDSYVRIQKFFECLVKVMGC